MTLKNTKIIFVAVLAIGVMSFSVVFSQNATAQNESVGKDIINTNFPTFDSPEIIRVTEIMKTLDSETTISNTSILIDELAQIKTDFQSDFSAEEHQTLEDKKDLVSNVISSRNANTSADNTNAVLEFFMPFDPVLLSDPSSRTRTQMYDELPIVGLYADEGRNALVIHVDSMKFSDAVAESVMRQVRVLVGTEIDIIVEPMGPFTTQMCSQTSNCEPVQAGVKISTPDGACSVGFKATYAGKTGFVTAGHCGSIGDGIGQPNYVYWDHIGTVYDNSFEEDSTYDGMFVDADETISDKIYYNKDISYAGSATYLDGVIMEGHVTKGVYGVVINSSYDGYIDSVWIKDMAVATYVGQSGDSGGIVYGIHPSDHLLGTHSGGYNGYLSAFSKQQNANNEFPGLVWQFN